MGGWGTPVGAVAGGIIGSLAGGVGAGYGIEIGATIGALIDGLTAPSPAMTLDRKYTGVSYGTPINRIWGQGSLDCPIIWAAVQRNGSYYTEVDEGKKSGTTQHYFATYAFMIAETGFTFADGTQQERSITIDRIRMQDLIVYTNQTSTVARSTIPTWSPTVLYAQGDQVDRLGVYYVYIATVSHLAHYPELWNSSDIGWWRPESGLLIDSSGIYNLFPGYTVTHAVHPGPSESTFTQAQDSTMTAYDGVGVTSAYRGKTYVTVTAQDLFYIGNTLPTMIRVECHTTSSLTHGDFLSDVCRLGGLSTIYFNFANCTTPLVGFVQNNRVAAKDLLTNFCVAFSYDLAEVDGVLRAVPRGTDSVVTIPDGDMGASLNGKPVDRMPVKLLADRRELHSHIQVRIKSPSRSYRSVDIISTPRGDALNYNAYTFDSGLSLDDTTAKQLASRLLDIEWLEGGAEYGPVYLPGTYGYLAPAAVVTINYNGAPTRFRITKMDWVMGLVALMLVRDEIDVLDQSGVGDGGGSAATPSTPCYFAFRVASPATDPAPTYDYPGFYVWAFGTPYGSHGVIWWSFDEITWFQGPTITSSQSFGLTDTTALANATVLAPALDTSSTTDFTYDVIDTNHGTPAMGLASQAQHSVQNGLQWALIGDEWVGIVHTGSPGPTQGIGPNLLRGLRHSPAAGHSVGEQFAVGNLPGTSTANALVKVKVDATYIGQTVYVRVIPPDSDIDNTLSATCVIASPSAITPPTVSSVTAGVPTYSGAGESVSFTANLATSPTTGSYFLWSYSTDSGSTWSATISTTSVHYTPPVFTTGTMRVRCVSLNSTITNANVDSTDVTYSSSGTTPYQETPSGAVDGVNTTYALTHTPATNTLHFYINSVLQIPGTDYTLAGSTITTTVAPVVSSVLWGTYSY